jgi:uncharacterized membrane protein YphA (DoxX/SURF4 family)
MGHLRHGILGLAVLATPRALAHEKWFTEGPIAPSAWDQLKSNGSLAATLAALGLTAVAAVGWRLRGGRDLLPGPARFGATPESRATFYAWVPSLLAIHLAIPLFILGLAGKLFSPNHPLAGSQAHLLGLVQVGIALTLFYGIFTRLAAVALALTWFGAIGVIGVEAALENIHYLGFALFFFCAGRSACSIDRLLFPTLQPRATSMALAMPLLRTFIGLSLIVVAFTEKLANPSLALEFLRQHPLNFTPFFGTPMSDAAYSSCCGAVELLVGLCVLFGFFPRAVLIVAWLPFNLTLTVFSWVELVGHLPFYGAIAALLVWTPDAEDGELWIRGLSRNTQ